MIKQDQHIDVLIIGSGPAGIAAAISCVKAGLKTTIITKANNEAKINDQPQPSESIHPGLSVLLKYLGCEGAIPFSSLSMYEGIWSNAEFNSFGSHKEKSWVGHHIDKTLFGTYLFDSALKQGVYIITNETVSDFIINQNRITGIKTMSGKSLFARYTIDASGQKRIAGNKLKFRKKYLSPPLTAWTGKATGISTNLFSTLSTSFTSHNGGWTWIAPEPPNSCTWTKLSLKGKKEFSPPSFLADYSGAEKMKVANVRWSIFRPLCLEGIILCGDAGGLLDPATGQGIFFALVSGIKAGDTALACIEEPFIESWHLAHYDNWFVTEYEEKANKLQLYYQENNICIFETAKNKSEL